jgi:EAL domain-containing protein (putative c-di-GMP-specific phosphodiesterase class I)
VTVRLDGPETVHEVIDRRAVAAVLQPIVDLLTGEVVAYEALARGPAGTGLARPDLLFAAAAAEGLTSALDRICRQAAIEAAWRNDLGSDLALFVNVEPAAMTVLDAEEPLTTAALPAPVVIEVTERAVADRPADLLAFLAAARERGLRVALDDVGAEDASLALMPFVRPDVVKLDLRLVQQRTRVEHARVVAAVLAYAEETGAVVLAEGIETPEHLEVALTLGATLGQGWHLGHPAATVAAVPPASPLVERLPDPVRGAVIGGTPFDLVAPSRPMRTGRRSLLLPLSRHLERLSLEATVPEVVVAAFQYGDRFTPATARLYTELAAGAALVAALGVDLPAEPAAGVRGASLAPDDRLRDEWAIAVVGPHYAGALVAREQPGTDPADPVFDFTMTHDRALVVRLAAALLARVLPR